MTPSAGSWVFGSGPVRHFASQGWLGVLKFLASGRDVYIPDTVERELTTAAADLPLLRGVLDAEWIHVFRSTDVDYQREFARFYDRLAVGSKNVGECGVLAMGAVYGCEMVIDDRVPRTVALELGLNVTATVPLLCQGIRAGQLTTPMVEALADDLISGTYYLPFERGGSRQHVLENGLLDYAELGL